MKRIATLPWSEDRPRHSKQLGLFCHLLVVLWQVSNRIAWRKLNHDDRSRVEGILPLLTKLTLTARAATKQVPRQEPDDL